MATDKISNVFDTIGAIPAYASTDEFIIRDKSDTTGDVGGTAKAGTISGVSAFILTQPAATVEDAGTNTVLAAATIRRTSSGVPANGIGSALNFEVETAAANNEIGVVFEAVTTDVTALSEDFDFVIKTMAAGATAAERARFNLSGLTIAAQLFLTQTITPGGTTGAQTINNAAGTVNFAAAATSLVVTCNKCTTSSTVYVTIRTNDATARIVNCVPGAGSFTINIAAATAETSVGFIVIN